MVRSCRDLPLKNVSQSTHSHLDAKQSTEEKWWLSLADTVKLIDLSSILSNRLITQHRLKTEYPLTFWCKTISWRKVMTQSSWHSWTDWSFCLFHQTGWLLSTDLQQSTPWNGLLVFRMLCFGAQALPVWPWLTEFSGVVLFHNFSADYFHKSITPTTGRLIPPTVNGNSLFKVMGQKTCEWTGKQSGDDTFCDISNLLLYSGYVFASAAA